MVIAAMQEDCSCAEGLQLCLVTATMHGDWHYAQGLQWHVMTAAMHADRSGAAPLEAAGSHKPGHSSKAVLAHAGINCRATSPRSHAPCHAAGP